MHIYLHTDQVKNHQKRQIMYKYSKDGISVLSVLDARRAKKSGLFPVKIQVIHNRRQKYYSTGQELSKEDWANLAESKSRRLTEARSNIENSFSIIKGQVEALAERGDFAFDLLSVRLGRCSTATVNAAIKAKTEELKRNGQAGTYRSYHALLTAVEEFAGKDIPFSAVTVDWLNRCGRFWTGQKKSKSTLSVYFKMLKAIMNRAKADGIIKEAHFPFGRNRFEIPSAEGRKLALTLEQIKRLVTYTDGREETELYRDMWFFSYLCNGINFRDMLYLTYGNIVDGEICFVRAKTMNTSKQVRTIRAVLTPEMRKIMDRWGNPDDGNPGTLIFKFATGKEDGFATKHLVDTVIQKCNKVLGRIAEAVGLPPVTTYSARHSFATVLKRSGTNISYISERLGQIYDGVISGVTEWGLYVELNENKCEGLVPVRDLDDDYYEFDEKNYCLRGRRKNKIYSLGDAITVRVARANLEKKQLDFELIEK